MIGRLVFMQISSFKTSTKKFVLEKSRSQKCRFGAFRPPTYSGFSAKSLVFCPKTIGFRA